jgi:predicted secreted Zn-dependent protease
MAQTAWKAVEKVETYAIAGATGPELYASIGERGPLVGDKVRTIAHTNFKLTWSRNYVPRDGACTLVSARPKLVITYTLPRPGGHLDPATQKRWDIFLAGMRAHEQVHGEAIKDMVRAIEQYSVGLTVPDDPDCRKIRQVLTARLSELSQEQRRRSREFDRVEHGEGGTIQRLILGLVNGS